MSGSHALRPRSLSDYLAVSIHFKLSITSTCLSVSGHFIVAYTVSNAHVSEPKENEKP